MLTCISTVFYSQFFNSRIIAHVEQMIGSCHEILIVRRSRILLLVYALVRFYRLQTCRVMLGISIKQFLVTWNCFTDVPMFVSVFL